MNTGQSIEILAAIGSHEDDVITDVGLQQIRHGTGVVADRLRREGIASTRLVSGFGSINTITREYWLRILMSKGVNVSRAQPDTGFNPVRNFERFLMSLGRGGRGFRTARALKMWRETPSAVPSYVEPYTAAAKRVYAALESNLTLCGRGEALTIVCDTAVIAACLDTWIGEQPDNLLPPGGIVILGPSGTEEITPPPFVPSRKTL